MGVGVPQLLASPSPEPSLAGQASPAGRWWLFLDPREGWIPREPGLACSHGCLGALMKTKCAAGSAPVFSLQAGAGATDEPMGLPTGVCARRGGWWGCKWGPAGEGQPLGGGRAGRQAGGWGVADLKVSAPNFGVDCCRVWGRETFLGCEAGIGVAPGNLQVLEPTRR